MVKLSEQNRQEIRGLVPKVGKVKITFALGDSEALQYASEIYYFMKSDEMFPPQGCPEASLDEQAGSTIGSAMTNAFRTATV